MGKLLFTPDHKFGFTQSDLASWFDYWDKLRKAGGAPPGDVSALSTPGDPSTFGIVHGIAAMNLALTNKMSGVQALMDVPIDLHMLPNGFADGPLKQHHYIYSGAATAVAKTSPNQAIAIDVINFMLNDPQGSEIFYSGSGVIPASKAARDKLAKTGSDADRKIISFIEEVDKNPAAPRYPGVTGMAGMLTRANQGVSFGKLTPSEAAKQFMDEAGARL
jgi:multiple sugar transport system substrate-binding protein